ncbi:hypothetical protein UFOVP591_41 [uncultured Caudovirales phage]|uniref:Uncharacterized protein n=1 Tax=uncultured Caudovirales phage TaxID=2100421 RepID=A0A6J5N862_9CAUD|nr:hypothetical protein UFOVP591_41 [uncultured Caudovirales phage]
MKKKLKTNWLNIRHTQVSKENVDKLVKTTGESVSVVVRKAIADAAAKIKE